jgi:hypothetical protein
LVKYLHVVLFVYRAGSTKVLNGPKVDLDSVGGSTELTEPPKSRKTKKPSYIFAKITKVL